jgi:hypothetical protein
LAVSLNATDSVPFSIVHRLPTITSLQVLASPLNQGCASDWPATVELSTWGGTLTSLEINSIQFPSTMDMCKVLCSAVALERLILIAIDIVAQDDDDLVHVDENRLLPSTLKHLSVKPGTTDAFQFYSWLAQGGLGPSPSIQYLHIRDMLASECDTVQSILPLVGLTLLSLSLTVYLNEDDQQGI